MARKKEAKRVVYILRQTENGEQKDTILASSEELQRAFEESKTEQTSAIMQLGYWDYWCLAYKDSSFNFVVGCRVKIKSEWLNNEEEKTYIYEIKEMDDNSRSFEAKRVDENADKTFSGPRLERFGFNMVYRID